MADAYSSQQSPHLVHRQRSRNVVLTKDDVGRAKVSTRNLPPPEHAFGISESWSTGGEGAREALTWAAHVPSPPRRPETDFRRLNKAGAVNHASTPKLLSQLRSTLGDFPQLPPEPRSPALIPSDVIPHFAYGKRSRPSTPIGSVLAHDYGNHCEDMLDQRYLRYDEHKKASEGPLKIKLTKAAGSQRRQEPVQPIEPAKLWKMSKFNKMQASIKQEAPLYRDEEGRLQRGRSPSPARMMKTSLSLPNLRVMSSNASGEKSPVGRPHEIDLTGCDEPDDDMRTETELSWSPMNASPASPVSPSDSESGCKAADESEDMSRELEGECAMPLLEETLDAAELSPMKTGDARASETTASETTASETDVSISFTVRHAFQRELKIVMSTLQGTIRSQFPDSVVKVGEFVVEEARQEMRDQQKRYLAWGQDALKVAVVNEEVDGVKPSALSPLRLMVTVIHHSPKELKKTVARVVDQMSSCFPSSILQVREVSPPVWVASSPRPQPKRAPRDGLGRPLPMALRS